MVCSDGSKKPSLQFFDIFSGKKQPHFAEKQALYEILEAPKFAEEPPHFSAEPPNFAEQHYSGCQNSCQKTRKSDGFFEPSPQTITPKHIDLQ